MSRAGPAGSVSGGSENHRPAHLPSELVSRAG